MTIDEVTLVRQKKNGQGFSVTFQFCRLRLFRLALKFSSEPLSLRLVPALEWVLGIRSIFLTILPYHLRMGI